MIRLSKTLAFDATHHFPGHPMASASTPHSHSYRVTGTIEGEPELFGMIVDANVFGAHLATFVAMLGADLNVAPGLADPSLENIARWMGERLELAAARWRIASVRVERPDLGEAAEWTP